jgi:hypothetical protein
MLLGCTFMGPLEANSSVALNWVARAGGGSLTSLAGQWIAQYSGSNSGTLVIELDDVGDHYEGTACAWDDKVGINTLISIRTPSKEPTQSLKSVPLRPMNNLGIFLQSADLEHLKSANGLQFPDTVDIDFDSDGVGLSVKWETPIGTSGSAVASVSRTRSGLPSTLIPLPIEDWEVFKSYVNSLERRRYIYRGQGNSEWQLQTSFHRSGRSSLDKYIISDVNELHTLLSSMTKYQFDLNNSMQYAAFISLAQHHGYPTPLLDWSWSPYVAAFFAMRNVRHVENNSKVRIYKFDCREWNLKTWHADKIFPFKPNVTVLNPLKFENTRSLPQQAISTMSNVDDIESHIQLVEKARGVTFLEAVDLRASQRDHIIGELALMGITAGSLFPGLEELAKASRSRISETAERT